ncbi:MAG: DUF4252 domain-containing protein [Bacteroidota bacterium]
MKKLVTVIFAVWIGIGFALGQSKTVREFHGKYKDDRDAKVVSLNGSLFKLMSAIASYDTEDEDAQVIARIGDGIESMDILSVPLFDSGLQPAEFDGLKDKLKSEKYEELMNVRDGRDRVSVMTQGGTNEVKNMVILIRDEDSAVVVNVNGTLDMKDIAYLAKKRKNWY